MQQLNDTPGGGHNDPDPPRGLKEEILGPPRRSVRAQFFAAIFALGTVTSIALSEHLDSPGQPLIYSGITAAGMSELLDPDLRRFTVGLRIAGPLIALAGMMLTIL